tara:strand:- start:689 stop:1264 length:576 start_codon:yes stop_codon:yes gene_type:complete
MTANDAIKSIKVMLGVAQAGETAETIDVQLAEATLTDGTRLEVDGDFEVGAQAFVITSEGERVEAPEGKHETTDGMVFTMDRVGVITAIEEVEDGSAESVDEVATSVTLSNDMVNTLVSALDSLSSKIETIEEGLKATNHAFEAFSNEPAGKKITNNLNEVKQSETDFQNARFDKILQFRKETTKINPYKK